MAHSLSNFGPLHYTDWDTSALVKAFEDATGAGTVIFASVNDATSSIDLVDSKHSELMLVASQPDVVHHLTSAEFIEGTVNSQVPIEVGHGSLGVRIFMREGVVWNEIGDAIVIRSSTKSIAVAVTALLLQVKRVWDNIDIEVVDTTASEDDQVIDLDDLASRIEGEVAE